MSDYSDWLADISKSVDAGLRRALNRANIPHAALRAAMQHGVLGGGKRLRPAMLFAVAEVRPGKSPSALAAACAVELIHCYSLIHDDLPCMDDDDTRRGKPACHKAHGETMALLAGDCLQSLAFETLACSLVKLAPKALLPAAESVCLLARAAGAKGMGGGQALDITAMQRGAGGKVNIKEIEKMHHLKTGALFDAALSIGVMCRAHVTREQTRAVYKFSRDFGLLYQIANDIADSEEDARAGKITYATALSPDEARALAAETQARALATIENFFPRLADITRAVYSS